MTSLTEWGDIPTSGDLFGGDFFGDDLMEMYSAIGESPSGALATAAAAATPLAADDEKNHPGLLIAMNAAAMDGGLTEFVPAGAPSNPEVGAAAATASTANATTAAPPPHPSTTQTAASAVRKPAVQAAAANPAAPSAPAAPPVQPAAKRTVASQAASTAHNPPKKRKGAPASTSALTTATTATTTTTAPAPAAAAVQAKVPKAKVAATGGVKITLPPGVGSAATATASAAAAAAVPAVSKGISKAGVAAAAPPVVPKPATATSTVAGSALLKKTVPAAVTAATAAPSAAGRVPVGAGINHQVVARPAAAPAARPPAVPSSVPSAPGAVVPPVRRFAPAPGNPLGAPRPTPSQMISSTGVIRAKSEADFKDVASAAVSSLIQNASGAVPKTVGPGPKPVTVAKTGDKTVDVSTAHINALTSQNWVTACNPIPTPAPPAQSESACDKAARNARRATLTQEERAKQNRDRNREHARNTRLRKKAYVEELKRTLTELVAQRDAADLEKRHDAQRNREQREVRFRVMEEFLKLRGRNEANAARWVAILEDGFTFTLPQTPFRTTVKGDGKKSVKDVNGGSTGSSIQQVIRGAAAVMEDSKHLAAYLQTIGGNASAVQNATQMQIVYQCDRKRFFMDGNVAFMDFNANTSGAVAKGADSEVAIRGSVRASFSPASNKLISVDIEFDTASFTRQVEAMGDVTSAAAAVAAHEADALLDSLQMPQIFVEAAGGEKDDGPAAPEAEAGAVSISSDDGERSVECGATAPKA